MALVGALMLTACASTEERSTATSTSMPSQVISATAERPAVDPCEDVTSCEEVASVDVDGDGSLDRVGISVTRQAAPAQVAFGEATTVVFIATGEYVERIEVRSGGAMPGLVDKPQPYVGAYRLSRTSGADLVLHTVLGQGNQEQFVVIGWADGKPLRVMRPPSGAAVQSSDVWFIGSSHGMHEWVTCAAGASLTMNVLSAPTAEGIPLPGGGIREMNHFAFEAGAWYPTGSENIADDNFSYDFDPHTQTFECEDLSLRR